MLNFARPCRDSSIPRTKPPTILKRINQSQLHNQQHNRGDPSMHDNNLTQQVTSQHEEMSDPVHGNGTPRRTGSETCGIEKGEKCFCNQIIVCSSPPR
ncbi:hypothetical protein NC653_034033 [Populus alba x Populus x berolinensis]|uniref:Uncharacterized protein n=1 Tax=Populus alba x Populus x berolinensis TaxID=444605 RepID=A0AAD6PZT5_9ROSI|nr:hypothetical protein NC653_034033 [Populus alba x Populus x berolinensis]